MGFLCCFGFLRNIFPCKKKSKGKKAARAPRKVQQQRPATTTCQVPRHVQTARLPQNTRQGQPPQPRAAHTTSRPPTACHQIGFFQGPTGRIPIITGHIDPEILNDPRVVRVPVNVQVHPVPPKRDPWGREIHQHGEVPVTVRFPQQARNTRNPPGSQIRHSRTRGIAECTGPGVDQNAQVNWNPSKKNANRSSCLSPMTQPHDKRAKTTTTTTTNQGNGKGKGKAPRSATPTSSLAPGSPALRSSEPTSERSIPFSQKSNPWAIKSR
jgi:hypothetical protein